MGDIQTLKDQNEKMQEEIKKLTELFASKLQTENNTSSVATNMSTTVPAPEKFSFQKEDWEHWIIQYERFRQATHLFKQDDKVQVNNLLLYMGSKVNTVLDSMNKKESELLSYEEAKKFFDDYYTKTNNIRYERAKFNLRNQHESESASEYIGEIVDMGKKLKYGALTDELIMDRLVVGILDKRLSRTLQLDSSLSLQSTIDKIMQSEAINKQSKELSHSQSTSGIDKISRKKSKVKTLQEKTHIPLQEKVYVQCGRCGSKPSHTLKDCPAYRSVCNKCNIRGHYSKMCQTAKLNEIEEFSTSSSSSESSYIPVIKSLNEVNKCPAWKVNLKINGEDVSFKVDTGADESVITKKQAESLGIFNKIKPSSTTLVGAGEGEGKVLNVHGYFRTMATVQNETAKIKVFVIDTTENLLGRPALVKLNLIKFEKDTLQMKACLKEVKKNESAESEGTPVTKLLNKWTKSKVERDYPELFNGLGKLKNVKHEIRVQPKAEPFAIQSPRRVPVPLMNAVKKELEKMVEQGVIYEVSDPTDWCAPLVVVHKSNGNVRICTDYTELNKYVQRERFQLPTVEETLAMLGKAKLFTRLDCSSGFHQIELSEESSKYTTFITPFARYAYKRVPFGIVIVVQKYSRNIFRRNLQI